MGSASFGNTTWIFLSLSIIVLLVFLLSSVNTCGSIEFCTATIFGIVLMFTLILIMIRMGIDGERVKNFLMKKPLLKDFIWIPIGIGGVIAVSLLASNIGEPLLGIGLSGIIMGIALIKTGFILIPIIIHGTYNTIVLNLRQFDPQSLLTQAQLNIPEIGLSFPDVSKIGTESLFQFTLVSASEEFLKAFIIIFVVVAINRGKFENKGFKIWIGLGVAVAVWAIYHTIALGQ